MLPPGALELVRLALAEDVGEAGDATTAATIPSGATGRAALIAREPAVLAGTEAFGAVYATLDDAVKIVWEARDGDLVDEDSIVARLDGPLATILTGERTALNFLQRLSGVATITRRFVEAAPGIQVRDTRKTTPGMRALEKAAVRAGGGVNHRMGLFDAILLKDNHVAACGGVTEAVTRVREARPGMKVQVECETLRQLNEAIAAGAEEALLDNMPPELMREAVAAAAGRIFLEASGGITLGSVAEVAATGVDAVSAGALTHSARSVDFSLELEAIDAARG